MKKKDKIQYTHTADWSQVTGVEKKTILTILLLFNEAGSYDGGMKLIKNKWVRKVYPLPIPTSPRYNSIKSVRSQYWCTIKRLIDLYIIEVIEKEKSID